MVFGVLVFRLSEFSKERGWCKYESKDSRKQDYALAPIVDDADDATVSLTANDSNGEHRNGDENTEDRLT